MERSFPARGTYPGYVLDDHCGNELVAYLLYFDGRLEEAIALSQSALAQAVQQGLAAGFARPPDAGPALPSWAWVGG